MSNQLQVGVNGDHEVLVKLPKDCCRDRKIIFSPQQAFVFATSLLKVSAEAKKLQDAPKIIDPRNGAGPSTEKTLA